MLRAVKEGLLSVSFSVVTGVTAWFCDDGRRGGADERLACQSSYHAGGQMGYRA